MATVEIKLRVKAANSAYHSASGMWSAGGGKWRLKVEFYKSIYLSTVVTGMCSFYFRNTDYQISEKEATKRARKSMGQNSAEKKGDEKFRKKSNQLVLNAFGLASIRTEMAIMRLTGCRRS